MSTQVLSSQITTERSFNHVGLGDAASGPYFRAHDVCKPCRERGRARKAEFTVYGERWCSDCFHGSGSKSELKGGSYSHSEVLANRAKTHTPKVERGCAPAPHELTVAGDVFSGSGYYGRIRVAVNDLIHSNPTSTARIKYQTSKQADYISKWAHTAAHRVGWAVQTRRRDGYVYVRLNGKISKSEWLAARLNY